MTSVVCLVNYSQNALSLAPDKKLVDILHEELTKVDYRALVQPFYHELIAIKVVKYFYSTSLNVEHKVDNFSWFQDYVSFFIRFLAYHLVNEVVQRAFSKVSEEIDLLQNFLGEIYERVFVFEGILKH